jgi:anti-sigma regulatory factor (Ser/Thr protein kinase)
MAPIFYKKLSKPFSPLELRQFREEQVQVAKAAGLSEILAWDLAAVADELVCNIVEHADAQWLEWSLVVEGMERAKLVLKDNGRVFNPAKLANTAETLAGDFTHRNMGLLMVRRTVESMEYNRLDDGSNELILSAGPPVQRRISA